jgi:hypothetical protein
MTTHNGTGEAAELFFKELERLKEAGPKWPEVMGVTPADLWDEINVRPSFAGLFDMLDPDTPEAQERAPLVHGRIKEAELNLELDPDEVSAERYLEELFMATWALALQEEGDEKTQDERDKRLGFAIELFHLFQAHEAEPNELDLIILSLTSAFLATVTDDAINSAIISAPYGEFITMVTALAKSRDSVVVELMLQAFRLPNMGCEITMMVIETPTRTITDEMTSAAKNLYEVGTRMLTALFGAPS